MTAGDRTRVLSVANTEKDPELRAEAVRQLGNMGAREELWALYQKETSPEIKRTLLQSMFNAGEATRITELATSESNPELRRYAVRLLGNMGARRTGDSLVKIYYAEKDPDIKRYAIQGLANQNNAEGLVAIARKETDMTLKKDIVSRLSNMARGNKVAQDYLLEILGK
jgi:HEAT repeat protein